jgi:hypothetical protein
MNYTEINLELNKIKDTHPNLVAFWKHYINIKKNVFEKSIENCILQIDNVKDINDPSFETLLFIYLLNRTI